MRKFFLLTVAALFAFSVASVAQTLKFGHFNSGEFINQLPDIQNVNKILNDEASKIENQVVVMREELGKMFEEYQKTKSSLTPEQLAVKEQELNALNERIQTYIETTRQDLQKKQQELVQPIIMKVRKAVEEVGANGDFLYIFESTEQFILFNGVQSEDIAPLVKAKLGLK